MREDANQSNQWIYWFFKISSLIFLTIEINLCISFPSEGILQSDDSTNKQRNTYFNNF